MTNTDNSLISHELHFDTNFRDNIPPNLIQGSLVGKNIDACVDIISMSECVHIKKENVSKHMKYRVCPEKSRLDYVKV